MEQIEMDSDLHLAWGKQPACGKVNRPTSDRLAKVTCKACLRVADRAFMVDLTTHDAREQNGR